MDKKRIPPWSISPKAWQAVVDRAVREACQGSEAARAAREWILRLKESEDKDRREE